MYDDFAITFPVLLTALIIQSAFFAAFFWMLHNRITRLEMEPTTIIPGTVMIVRRTKK